jgi:predicted AAA+ superfamily ATPase
LTAWVLRGMMSKEVRPMIARNDYLKRLIAYKDNVIIKVIVGMRRCGKSTLLQLYQDYLLANDVSSQNIIYINFELMEYDGVRDYKDLYQLLKKRIAPAHKNYILLDEIQQVIGWEKVVNSLVLEADIDMYITGSNAYLLSSELSTMLSGRYVEIRMLPLSFKEYLTFQQTDEKVSLEDRFTQYVKFGSLPGILSLPQDNTTINDYLLGIYNTVILKDVVQRNNIRDITLLEQVLKVVVNNVGNIISANKISAFITSESKGVNTVKSTTIDNYLTMLENAFILYKALRYDIKGKENLKSLAKYYVVDTGIRNLLLGYTDTDYGHILENIVYLELLRRGYQVFIGKWYEAEVDFVAIKQEERKYYQVTYSLMNENVKAREMAPLMAIPDNYEKIILSMDKNFITDHDGIKFMNILDFLTYI